MTAASTSTFDPHKMLGSKTHRFCFRLPCFRYVFCSISVELLRRVTDWERPRKEESIAPGVTKRIEGQQSIAVCSFDSTVNGMFLSRRARTNHGEQGMEIPDSWGAHWTTPSPDSQLRFQTLACRFWSPKSSHHRHLRSDSRSLSKIHSNLFDSNQICSKDFKGKQLCTQFLPPTLNAESVAKHQVQGLRTEFCTKLHPLPLSSVTFGEFQPSLRFQRRWKFDLATLDWFKNHLYADRDGGWATIFFWYFWTTRGFLYATLCDASLFYVFCFPDTTPRYSFVYSVMFFLQSTL